MSLLPRLVSLVPSATETLVALGADVTACTRFCKQPGIATVGGTKNPDVAAIIALAPDRVVVDTEENRREDAEALAAAGLDVVVTAVRTVDEALAAVDQLAAAAGRPAPDPPAPAERGRGNQDGPVARAFVPIWRRPWMTINRATYGASLLGSIGIDLVTAAMDESYPPVSLDAIARLDPELVLVPSEPYDFSDDHVATLAGAFAGARVVRVDGEDLFWWGVRTPAARRRLAAAIRPTGRPH